MRPTFSCNKILASCFAAVAYTRVRSVSACPPRPICWQAGTFSSTNAWERSERVCTGCRQYCSLLSVVAWWELGKVSQSDSISSPLCAMTLGNIFYFIIYGVLQGFRLSYPYANPSREVAFWLLPFLPGNFCLVWCLLPCHLRNQLLSDYPKANGAPLASVLLAPRVEVWTEKV